MTRIDGLITAGLGFANSIFSNAGNRFGGFGLHPSSVPANPFTDPFHPVATPNVPSSPSKPNSNPVRPVTVPSRPVTDPSRPGTGPARPVTGPARPVPGPARPSTSSHPSRPLPTNPGAGKSAGSPDYPWRFQNPLPIPAVAQPLFTETVNGIPIQYYETTIEPFQQQVYPNLGPANLIGYGGVAPGATFEIPRGTETVIRYVNRGNLSSAVHLHGSYTHSTWDGWAFDEIEPGQYKDYYYPNTESARSMWYHDHAHGHTANDAYYGQSGAYYLTDPAEDVLGLPKGKYQVPLALMDKAYQANGDLAPPDRSNISFFGDTIEVNNQPWPYFQVEPRKYLFRVFDMSLSRVYDIYLADENNNTVQFQMVASDSGLFQSPVSSNAFTIAPGERYEFVCDFSGFAGSNVTMMNAQRQQPDDTKFAHTDEIMRFVVGTTVSDKTNNGKVPSSLANVNFPPNRDTIDHEFNFQVGGAAEWTINGVDFSDPNSRVLARPPQGTVERWRFRHTGGEAVHPVHVHLVNLQVISRTGGSRGLAPYETAGLKDVVLLLPGETVDVLAMYGPWNGMYMFHCHNLIHEDNSMMAAFNTTRLRELGYEYSSTQGFADPSDSRFTAKDYDVSAFNDRARREKVRMFGKLNAYAPAQRLQAAENAYYSTAGYKGDIDPVKPAKTAPPESVGVGFLSGVQPTATGVFVRAAEPTMGGQPWRA